MKEELAAFTYFEICGVTFAIISVLLAIYEKRACWPAAIISSLAYIPTFYSAKLYTETILQLFFIWVSIIGWKNWEKKGLPEDLKISSWGIIKHAQYIIGTGLISIILGYIMSKYTSASFPYADSAITVFSILTSFLQARKVLESWIYWIVIDALAISVYIQKSLQLTAGLYGLYLVLATLGYRQWLILKREQL